MTIHSGKGNQKEITPPKHADIAEISAYAFMKISEKPENQVIALWPRDFEQLTEPLPGTAEFTTDIAAITANDYEKFFSKMRKKPPSLEQLKERVLKAYHKWIGVWNPTETNKLSPHRSIDHEVHLKKGASPPVKRAYDISREQASVVKEYIDEMLGKGYIRSNTSPYTAPVLIVKKPDEGLWLYVDYRALNALTIPNQNAPPLIKETLAKLYTAKIYSKFDIITAFNEIRIKKGHKEKTAFLTRYDLYEYMIMPFNLCNAPATFQTFINNVLREYLNVFCTAYLDDILIYSNTKEEHLHHIDKVLKKLQKAGLYLDINKCDFHTTRIKYLELIITTDGVQINSKKIETIT